MLTMDFKLFTASTYTTLQIANEHFCLFWHLSQQILPLHYLQTPQLRLLKPEKQEQSFHLLFTQLLY